ncbi:hypothetical protein QYM36_009515 [Artemia franciscana]|uniref:Uncharacterized protein n=1 Tax=Artemia franciscana TaxID=6661 RepID=A0AA88HKQ4_ARTSF|nr:hypothetical protein QYM36_009515 [Artemia franciscana]
MLARTAHELKISKESIGRILATDSEFFKNSPGWVHPLLVREQSRTHIDKGTLLINWKNQNRSLFKQSRSLEMEMWLIKNNNSSIPGPIKGRSVGEEDKVGHHLQR